MVLYSLTIHAQQHGLTWLWKEEPLCTQKRTRLELSDVVDVCQLAERGAQPSQGILEGQSCFRKSLLN